MNISAVAPPNSNVKLVDTTISEGVAMLANCEFISERIYLKLILNTGSHALLYSVKTMLSKPWIMRCSVAVKSRPSTRVWKRPSPPNKLSTTKNTKLGSKTKSDVPRKGCAKTKFKLVGTTRLRINSPYFWTRMGPTEISAFLCM